MSVCPVTCLLVSLLSNAQSARLNTFVTVGAILKPCREALLRVCTIHSETAWIAQRGMLSSDHEWSMKLLGWLEPSLSPLVNVQPLRVIVDNCPCRYTMKALLTTAADFGEEQLHQRNRYAGRRNSTIAVCRPSTRNAVIAWNKKAQLSLTNSRHACEKFARFT